MKGKLVIHALSLCLALFTAVTSFAQTATIRGKVSLSNNEAADNISVVLKGTQIGAVTDTQGIYEIKNIKAGTYVLKVSAVGFSSKEKSITVQGGDELVENFTVATSSEELSEVVVNGVKTNTFARKESAVVSKMPLKDIENPQVYNTISAELMKEQVISNFDDALKNAPGIDKLWESTGRAGDGAGYFSLRGFAVQPTMVNGLPSLTNGSPDPANIESIEVIKGPSGTLFGSSLISYGGLINVNTKKPFQGYGGNVSYIGGTYGLNRVTFDYNTPLNAQKNVLFRVNAAYHTENSFQDAGFKKSLFIAPSLSYTVNDRLSFLINTEFYNGKSTNQTMLFLDRDNDLLVHNMDELHYDKNRSYTSNDLYMETPSYNLQGQMNYKLSGKWTSQTVLSRTSAKSNGYYSYLYEATQSKNEDGTLVFAGLEEGIVLSRWLTKQNAETYGTDIQQNFIGDFKIGNLRNRIVAGLDYFNNNSLSNNAGYTMNGLVYIGNGSAANVNAVVYGVTTPNAPRITDNGILSQAATDALLAGSAVTSYKTKQETYSAYASDVLNITPALSAMASLRVDRFITDGDITTKADDYNQTAFSPKFGLVYQPILNKISVFANYMNGFTNVAPVTATNSGNTTRVYTFEPEQANQFEFGTKLNLLGDKLVGTISYYDIKVDNTVIQVGQGEYIQDGQQQNKGFEASITANPIPGFNIIAGYSYTDSRLLKAQEANQFLGRRPESAAPRNLANLWASYKFMAGELKGFGLGFGGNYGSKNATFNRTEGVFNLPEYTVLNASLFYSSEAFSITAKLDNLTDKEYYKGWSTINPQKPRVFSVGVTYNF